MNRYGKVTEMDLKENHKRFDEALDNTIPIEKYYEIIDDWIQYADDVKQPHTAAQIIKKFPHHGISYGPVYRT